MGISDNKDIAWLQKLSAIVSYKVLSAWMHDSIGASQRRRGNRMRRRLPPSARSSVMSAAIFEDSKAMATPVAPAVPRVFAFSMHAEQSIVIDPESPGGINSPHGLILFDGVCVLCSRGCRFVLLYGARNETELLYGEEFDAFARKHEGFDFHPCFSRGARPNPRPHDRLGYVQDMLAELEPTADQDIAYLCGNPNMVDAAFAALKEHGLAVQHIRREKYISSR